MSSMLATPNVEQQALVYCFERAPQDIEKPNQMFRDEWQINFVISSSREEEQSDRSNYPPTVTYFNVCKWQLQLNAEDN
jgi:hypothetical protein